MSDPGKTYDYVIVGAGVAAASAVKGIRSQDPSGTVGVFGGHTDFGDARRWWDFRSVGRGMIDFESVIVALNDVGYDGPLSVEWEDSRMDRVHGATESAAYCRRLDFPPAGGAFDAAFEKPAGKDS